jgi:predicted PurR-regulated permease PerM
MARFVSFLVLVAILVLIAIVFFRVMAGFLVPLFLAALLGVVVQPLHRWTRDKTQGVRYADYLAAGITTTLVALIVVLPIGLVVTTAAVESLSLLDQLQLANVRIRLDELRRDFGLDIPREADVRRIEVTLRSWRDKQRKGEPIDLKREQVTNLLQRVADIQNWLSKPEAEERQADVRPLQNALTRLRDSDPESVDRDEALTDADAEFREFKRNLLGGTYRAWLAEWANPSEERIDQMRANVLAAARPLISLGGDTLALLAKLLFGTLIMIVALFFLLAEGSRMLDAVVKLVPLEEQHVRELAAEFDRACRAIVSATLLSAIAQGLLAGFGFFFIADLRGSVALLTLLTMVLALVPFTGAAAVWIPVSLYVYFFQDSTWAAVALAIYGAVVVSGADNVIKPLVLHGQSNLHPLLALLSVLGGIQALGPIGIVIGPMAVVFLQVLLKLVQRELSSMDRSSWVFWRGFGGAEPAAVAVAAGPTIPADAPVTPSQPQGNGRAAGAPSSPPKQHHQSGKKRKR